MPSYKFTEIAYADLDTIVDYTLEQWGVDQAIKYIDGLEKQAQLLADMPTLALLIDEPYDKIRVFPYEKHNLFFIEEAHGITIIRVTHENMDFDAEKFFN